VQKKRDRKELMSLKRISGRSGGRSGRWREAKPSVTSASPWPLKLKSLVFSSLLADDTLATAH